jgi:hypothetical protein
VGLTFFDPRTGERREFKPAAPPTVGVALDVGAGPRESAVGSALMDALIFVGLRPRPGREIAVGGGDPGPAVAWLKAEPLSGSLPDAAALSARGFASEDLRFFMLGAHYRRPLAFDWDALASARAERSRLSAAAREHAEVTSEPSARALAGYLLRFREALARDLDVPEARACLWDALRPGALSPGSRAALLRQALPVLDASVAKS